MSFSATQANKLESYSLLSASESLTRKTKGEGSWIFFQMCLPLVVVFGDIKQRSNPLPMSHFTLLQGWDHTLIYGKPWLGVGSSWVVQYFHPKPAQMKVGSSFCQPNPIQLITVQGKPNLKTNCVHTIFAIFFHHIWSISAKLLSDNQIIVFCKKHKPQIHRYKKLYLKNWRKFRKSYIVVLNKYNCPINLTV